jgi:hypothetical protein
MNRHDPSPGTLAPAPPGAIDDARVAHEQRDRVIAVVVTILPLLGLAVGVWRAWQGLLRPGDEACGLAWDVVRIAPDRQAREAIDTVAG